MFSFSNFKKNTRGNISMMFGASIMVIVTITAIATDMASMVSSKSTLRSQMDSAALAAAVKKADNLNDANFDVDDAVREALYANGYDIAKYGMPDITDQNGVLTLSAVVPHDLTFGKLLGMETADIEIDSMVAANSGGKVEIALVLDSTASMGFEGRIGALRIAGRDFIDTIEAQNLDTRIAIVPFNRYVRVSTDLRGATWLDVPDEYDTQRTWQQATHTCGYYTTEERTETKDGVEYTYDHEVCHDRTTTYEPRHKTIESRWEGCVGMRSEGLHLVDGDYNLELIPGLLNTIPHERTDYYADKETWCPHTIRPLTNDYETLKVDIRSIYPTDSTYIPTGLSWAQRVLSGSEPYANDAPDGSAQKVVVLMTDGDNRTRINPVPYNDTDNYHGIPYVEDLDHGVAATQANADTLTMCDNLKAEGTQIYTVAFRVPDAVTKGILRECASNPSQYFDAGSNDQLAKTFVRIADSLESELRLLR